MGIQCDNRKIVIWSLTGANKNAIWNGTLPSCTPELVYMSAVELCREVRWVRVGVDGWGHVPHA